MQDSILVAGYPMGGDSLSITKGIVSRVTMTRYTHASNKLLGIQIDAAINPGNSGGPSFTDLHHGKVRIPRAPALWPSCPPLPWRKTGCCAGCGSSFLKAVKR